MDTSDPGLSVCFAVQIDDNDLGTFNSCEGLGCEVVIEQREEGGNNGFIWQLPTRLKYSNVKFSRPLSADTAKVAKWFASMAGDMQPRTATISVMSGDGKVVATWELNGLLPVRW